MDQDQIIVDQCRRGRQEGFARLLLAYQERVYRRAYSLLNSREDALDMTQEVFLRCMRSLNTFEPGRPLWPWLRRITTNLCLNHLRDRPHLLSLDHESLQGTMAGGEDPESAAMASWTAHQLQNALERLPPLYRMAVVLRHHDGLSYEEVARTMEVPLGTAKTYLFRARQLLKSELTHCQEG